MSVKFDDFLNEQMKDPEFSVEYEVLQKERNKEEMNVQKVNESDWKLFRKRVPEWQEAYMDKLNHEYIELLSKPGQPSDKFWELEKRIKIDRRSPGVVLDMRRSTMFMNIIGLLSDGVITLKDLVGFSQDLQDLMAQRFSK